MQTLVDYQLFVDELLSDLVLGKTLEDRSFYLERLRQFVLTHKKEKMTLARALLEDSSEKYLLHLTPDNFLLIDSENRFVEGATFEMPYFIEMMALIYLFGLRKGWSYLVEQAIGMAYASLALLTRHNQLPIGFASPDHYDIDEMRANYGAVMRSMAKLGGYRAFEGIGQCKLETNLSLAIDQIDDAPFFPQVVPKKKTIPFYNLSDHHSTLLIDSFGYKTGWGTFEMEDVEVRSFGVGGEPVGAMSSFGTARMIDFECEDHQLYEEGDVTTLKGWTRLLDQKSFAHLHLTKEDEALRLRIRLAENDLDQKMFTMFFVKADSAQIEGGKQFELRSLDKYCGPVHNVSFRKGENCLHFEADTKDEMHLIPLEGENYFYGADYLLAYELGELDGLFHFNVYK